MENRGQPAREIGPLTPNLTGVIAMRQTNCYEIYKKNIALSFVATYPRT